MELCRFERCLFRHPVDTYMRAAAISIAAIVAFLTALSYLEFTSNRKPPPSLPLVFDCKEPAPGVRRIGEQVGYQFDVPIDKFTISEGSTDAPPLIHGFDIRPKNSMVRLSISWGETTTMSLPDPIHESSEHVQKRTVIDKGRQQIGEESWGYWGQGERWRRVHLPGRLKVRYGSKSSRDIPSYGSVHQQDAARFDEIISSACLLAPSN